MCRAFRISKSLECQLFHVPPLCYPRVTHTVALILQPGRRTRPAMQVNRFVRVA